MMKIQKRAAGFLIMCALLMTGCASRQIQPVQNASGYAVTDGRLIAFSVLQSEQLPMRSLELVVEADSHGRKSATRVELNGGGNGPALALYRLPAGDFRFGTLRFYDQQAWWETTIPGPEIQAAGDGLTYLGRIQLQSVQIRRYVDSARKYPAAVQLTVSDSSADDLPRIFGELGLASSVPVTKALPGSWGDSEYVPLIFRPIPGRARSYDEWITGPVGPEVRGTPKSNQ